MKDSLTRALIQALASNPHLLVFSLQRSLPVSDDATPGEVQGAPPATTSTSGEPSTHLHVSPTALDLPLGPASLVATIDESALKAQPMSPTTLDVPLEPACPTAAAAVVVDESTLEDQPMSPTALDGPLELANPTAAAAAIVDESTLVDHPMSPKAIHLPPATTSDRAIPAEESMVKESPPPPFIDLRKYLAQSRRQAAKPSTTVRKLAPPINPPVPPLSGVTRGPSAAPMDENRPADHEKQAHRMQHSSEDESTDSDSSMDDDPVEQDHSIAQPASDSVISGIIKHLLYTVHYSHMLPVVVSRIHQEGSLQGLSIPIFPQAAKTLHGRTYIKLQDVMHFIMLSDWSISEPQSGVLHFIREVLLPLT